MPLSHCLLTYFDQFEGDHDVVADLLGLEDVGKLALACQKSELDAVIGGRLGSTHR